MATDWPEKEKWSTKLIRWALFFIPEANPGYKKKMHLIKEWLIECDEEGNPCREIGLDNSGRPIIAGPSEKNYGFWCDSNITIESFSGEAIDPLKFESLWKESRVKELKTNT